MSLQVLDEKVNPLLGRREVRLVIQHSGAGTPDRVTVRKMASEHYRTSPEQVYVRSIATRTGGSSALCMVEVYDNARVAGKVPAYVKNRNLPKDQRVSKKKGEEGAAPAPTPAAAAPKPAAEKPPAAAKPAEKPAGAPAKPQAEKPAEKPAAKPAAAEKPKK